MQFSLIENGDLTEQGKAILQAASEGELTPTQAGSLLSGLGTLAKVKEIDELEKRITALEKDRKSTRLNSSHEFVSRMPSSA